MVTISTVEIFAALGAVALGGIMGGLCGTMVFKLFNK
jgi:hypothetical protein